MTTTSANGTQVSTAKKVPITVAYGDGIGPEIMDATLRIVRTIIK